jgi:hypothetical protein
MRLVQRRKRERLFATKGRLWETGKDKRLARDEQETSEREASSTNAKFVL